MEPIKNFNEQRTFFFNQSCGNLVSTMINVSVLLTSVIDIRVKMSRSAPRSSRFLFHKRRLSHSESVTAAVCWAHAVKIIIAVY